MRTLILFFILFLSGSAFSHEIQFVGQHLKINLQQETAWQSDVLARATVNSKWEAGLQATYLDRFDFHEKRIGALLYYRPIPSLKLEAKYLKGEEGVEILPKDHYFLNVYHSLAQGISPFLIYQNALYSTTHLQTIRFGIEIEKIKKIILVPMVMLGQSQLKDPGEVHEVNSFGLKAFYFEELNYFLSLFAFKGLEISQAVTGVSGDSITTTTGGFGLGKWFFQDFKAEFIFDYTDYDELNNQFLSSTLNLVWGF